MTDFEQVVETIKRHTARDTVTMNRPLEPWGHTRFHKALALHIHQATRPAGHGSEMANFGIMDSEADARMWDRSME